MADHEEFVDWLAATPEDATVEFRASGTGADVADRTTATVGAFSLRGEVLGGGPSSGVGAFVLRTR